MRDARDYHGSVILAPHPTKEQRVSANDPSVTGQSMAKTKKASAEHRQRRGLMMANAQMTGSGSLKAEYIVTL